MFQHDSGVFDVLFFDNRPSWPRSYGDWFLILLFFPSIQLPVTINWSWTWNKGYHKYRNVCFISWHTLRNWQWCRWRRKLYNKRDAFNFPIVNFPFICSNFPAAPTYGVYSSQLIRYSRVCGIIDTGLLLTRKRLNNGFLVAKLKSSLRKFYGRRNELVNRLD